MSVSYVSEDGRTNHSRATLITAAGDVSPSPTPPPFTLSRASKDIAFGSLAGMVSKVFEHPFDLVKVRLQTQPTDRPALYSGAVDCFRQTCVKEGARGLFRGLSMPVFGATLENATLFFTYNFIQGQIRQALGTAGPSSSSSSSSTSPQPSTSSSSSSSSLEADAENPLSMGYLAIAAACAGSTTSFVLTPIELIKCKMQVQMITREVEALAAAEKAALAQPSSSPLAGMAKKATATLHTPAAASGARQLSTQIFVGLDGPASIARKILARDGFRGLWVGQTGTMLRETGGGVAWFLAFEWACRRMIDAKRKATPVVAANITKKDLSSAQLVGAGALAGVSYNVVLFPADSVKSSMQTEREWYKAPTPPPHLPGQPAPPAAAAYAPRGFLSTLAHIYKTRGFRGLYAGCGVTCMRSAPSSALIFLLYNKLETLADEYGI